MRPRAAWGQAGARNTGIPPHEITYLVNYVAAPPVTGHCGLPFLGRNGTSLMSGKALRYAYAQARKITGRSDLAFHDMRHSAASLAGMTGATTAELKAMMGHATAGMVERYQHANRTSRSRLGENMSKLVDLYSVPSPGKGPSCRRPGSPMGGGIGHYGLLRRMFSGIPSML
jgi:integrase